MKTPIKIELSSGKVEFLLDLDGDFRADQALVHYYNKNGACEPEVVHFMLKTLKPGDTAVDGGANVGFFTMLMAQLVGPAGHVYAFEPAEQNIHKLAINAQLNKFTNVTIVSNPLWSAYATVTLYMGDDSSVFSLARHPGMVGQVEKQGIGLHAYLIQAPKLIKLDVEGSELHALKGCDRFLSTRSTPYVICELNGPALQQMGVAIQEVRQFMFDRGYSMYMLHPNGRFPTLLPLRTKLKSDKRNLNVLFTYSLDRIASDWDHETILASD